MLFVVAIVIHQPDFPVSRAIGGKADFGSKDSLESPQTVEYFIPKTVCDLPDEFLVPFVHLTDDQLLGLQIIKPRFHAYLIAALSDFQQRNIFSAGCFVSGKIWLAVESGVAACIDDFEEVGIIKIITQCFLQFLGACRRVCCLQVRSRDHYGKRFESRFDDLSGNRTRLILLLSLTVNRIKDQTKQKNCRRPFFHM